MVFGDEFRQLRLGMVVTVVCALAAGFCLLQGRTYSLWAIVFLLPLVMVALAIFHQWVAVKKVDPPWVAGFYILLVVFTPVFPLVLAVIGFLDVWLNIRRSFRP